MNRHHRAPSVAIADGIAKHLTIAKDRLAGELISPYQTMGVRFMVLKELTGPGCILADDMGLGKTVMTVALILAMHKPGQDPTLVVAPRSVCEQWRSEVHRFSDLRCVVFDKRLHAHDVRACGADVIVVSYSFFSRVSCATTSLFGVHFHRVILDEAHYVKNPNTASSLHIQRLSTEKRLCLSGTPIQNDPKDLFALVRWIFQDDQVMLERMSKANVSKIARARCTQYVRDHVLLRRTLDDAARHNPHLSLPALDVRTVYLPFAAPAEAALYARVEDIARERIEVVLKSHNSLGNMDILEALLRCRQMCIHPSLLLDAVKANPSVRSRWDIPQEMRDTLPDGSTKLTTLVDMIRSQPADDKTLVFCAFVKEMVAIRSMLEAVGVVTMLYYGDLNAQEREDVLNAFRSHECLGVHRVVLVIQMNAGGTGLNLQAANRCYVTSPAYNPALEMQCIARSHRNGQTKPVTCIRLIMKDSVEERIVDIQQRKLDMIAEVLDDSRVRSRLSHMSISLSIHDICHLFGVRVAPKDLDECEIEVLEDDLVHQEDKDGARFIASNLSSNGRSGCHSLSESASLIAASRLSELVEAAPSNGAYEASPADANMSLTIGGLAGSISDDTSAGPASVWAGGAIEPSLRTVMES